MKRLILISCFVAVAVLGCKEPTSVVLDREEDLLEVTALPPADPDVELSAIDSTAILPSDENAFAGLLIIFWPPRILGVAGPLATADDRRLVSALKTRRPGCRYPSK